MKLKGASGYSYYVSDLDKTADFYTKLGLQIKERTDNRIVIYLNWYRIDLVKAGPEDYAEFRDEADKGDKGAGVFLYFNVDDVDATYKELADAGIKPATEPADQPWGNREFVILDPDGYKLVIFKRKAAKNPLN
ncbi:MAG TPA: VOC family protein [Candidatus Saccharimonadales bacterium]|nr:VOC family protein [Candidatus Saccharimonadales bacterium]